MVSADRSQRENVQEARIDVGDDEARIERQDMLNLATRRTNRVTFTCVPPGSGIRMALDRDRDGRFNRDEIDAGTNPAVMD